MKSTIKSRKAFVEWYKASCPCTDCGRSFPAEALDLDHISGKIGSIGSFIQTGPDEALWNEIAKCEVVCACCHRIRTKARGMSSEAKLKISLKGKGKSKPHSFKVDWVKFHSHQRRAVVLSDGREFLSISSAASSLGVALVTFYRRLHDGKEIKGITAKFKEY